MLKKFSLVLLMSVFLMVSLTGCNGDSDLLKTDKNITKGASKKQETELEEKYSKPKDITVKDVYSADFTILENFESWDGKKSNKQISVSEVTKPSHQIGVVEKDLTNSKSKTNQYYYLSNTDGKEYTEYKYENGSWNEKVEVANYVPTYITIVNNDTSIVKDLKETKSLRKNEKVYTGELESFQIYGLQNLVYQRGGLEIPDNAKVKVVIGVSKNKISRMSLDLSEWYAERNEVKNKQLKYQVIIKDTNKITEVEVPTEALTNGSDVRKTPNGLEVKGSDVMGTDWKDFKVYLNGDLRELGNWTSETKEKDTDSSEWVKLDDSLSVKRYVKDSKVIYTGIKVDSSCDYDIFLPSDIKIGSTKVEVESAYGKANNYEYKSNKGYLNLKFDGDKVSEIEYVVGE